MILLYKYTWQIDFGIFKYQTFRVICISIETASAVSPTSKLNESQIFLFYKGGSPSPII